jgi:hypothetical protein
MSKLATERLAESRSKLNAALDRISERRAAVLRAVKTLSEAESKEVIHPGLFKSALEARRLLVDKMNRSLTDFPPLEDVSTDALTNLGEKLTKMVNFTTSAVTTHGRHVRMLFGPQLGALQLHLKGLHESTKEAHATIKDALEKTRSLDSLLSKINSEMELLREIDAMRRESGQLEEKLPGLEKLVESENIKLKQFMESEEFKRTNSLREEIQRIEKEIAGVKSAVTSTLSSISRPLRKMEKLVLNGKFQLERESETALKLCTRDPLAVVSSDEKASAAQSVLQQTLGLLEKGEIDLSERERVKRIEVIREVVQGQKLKRYRTLLDRLLKEREERLRAWEKLPHLRRSELEQSVERRRSELRGVQAAIEDLKRKIRLAEEETKRKLVEIERLASELLGTEVELVS